VVLLGSMFRSTHFAHVLSTSLYATGRSTSTYSVEPWSKDPLLQKVHGFHQIRELIALLSDERSIDRTNGYVF
jgi:hypothetical protein